MPNPKKLIEVAMPVKEVSAESVRDKSIRHGHISTLHLWWARRPLPVCRAVVFASLVPDPLDPGCPQAFKEAVELLLGKATNPGDPYKPYDDIPYTSAIDRMDDNGRYRLLMFIGKFSDEYARNEKAGKKTDSKKQISDHSLIKWESKNNEAIINRARKLIWVAHNAKSGADAKAMLNDFDAYYNSIKSAEGALYAIPNRHLSIPAVQEAEAALQNAIDAFLDKMPKVFDPFAGGGAIPLEAARLGCRSYGNDINPVAHIIQKGSLEFPQKFGKPITYSKEEFVKLYGEETWKAQPQTARIVKGGDAVGVRIENRLAFDVEFHAKKLLELAEKEVGHLYPADEKGNKPIAYYWARVGTCSNPSCRAEVPLLKGFYLASTETKKLHLKPNIRDKRIDFEIKSGNYDGKGWMDRGNLSCPVCGNTTDVKTLKKQFISGSTSERLLVLIKDGVKGKEYVLPSGEEISILRSLVVEAKPTERMPVEYTQAMPSCTWGFKLWSDMFTERQLISMLTLTKKLNELDLRIPDVEYEKAIRTYLGIVISKYADYNNSFTVWTPNAEQLSHAFSKQALPMVFDFPESNPFRESGGSPINMMNWVVRYIISESVHSFPTILNNASSGDKYQFDNKFLTAVVTDPPYYDAIAYGDISDFFYVWLKRSLINTFPLNFSTPQTPKSEECTALKHHHDRDMEKAKRHFESKLLQIFDAIEHQTSDIISIMFAHQSTEAWTTLCNSILGAKMNITGSWAIDSERANRTLGITNAVLASSVTVSCTPTFRSGYGDFKTVKLAIERTVAKEVSDLYRLGFRGADLLTACFGKAVSEFGKHEKVEKADGGEVSVAELLELAREAAFNALLKGFDGDEFTKFYIGWLQLYGFTESDFDDAARFTRVGVRIEVQELFKEYIFIKNEKAGNRQTLGTAAQRLAKNKKLGTEGDSFLIDQVHKAMHLYQSANRTPLLQYLARVAPSADAHFWRVVTSLDELLPKGTDDHQQVNGLLANKENLLRESKNIQTSGPEQTTLDL